MLTLNYSPYAFKCPSGQVHFAWLADRPRLYRHGPTPPTDNDRQLRSYEFTAKVSENFINFILLYRPISQQNY